MLTGWVSWNTSLTLLLKRICEATPTQAMSKMMAAATMRARYFTVKCATPSIKVSNSVGLEGVFCAF